MRFMMDAIPNDLIVSPCSHTASDCENQFTVESFFEQLKYLVSFFVVGKIGASMSSWERNVASFSGIHTIINYNGADCFVAVTMHEFINVRGHFSWGLVANHLTENSGANWTSDPVFVTFKIEEARFMQQMTAGKTDDIFVRLLNQLIFVASWLLVLELADAAFVVSWFLSA